jgi:hypothetical protein
MGDFIGFKQEEIRNYSFGKLYNIIAKVTGVIECKLSKKPCNCRIIGDGQRHHYGVKFP